MRLGSATSVGMWGLILYYFLGPLWVVDTVLAACTCSVDSVETEAHGPKSISHH